MAAVNDDYIMRNSLRLILFKLSIRLMYDSLELTVVFHNFELHWLKCQSPRPIWAHLKAFLFMISVYNLAFTQIWGVNIFLHHFLLFKVLGSGIFFLNTVFYSARMHSFNKKWLLQSYKKFCYKRMLFFWTFNSSRNPEKNYHRFNKNMKQFSTLIIIRNVSWAPNQHIRIILLKNQLWHRENKQYFEIYSNRKWTF